MDIRKLVAMMGWQLSALARRFSAFWNFNEVNGAAAVNSIGQTALADNGSVTRVAAKNGNAAHFVAASNQYFSGIDQRANFGDENWFGVAMVKLTTVAGAHVILSKYLDVGNQRSYLLWTQLSKIELSVWGSGGGAPTALVRTPTLVVGVWYMIYFWHDAVNDKIGIQVNLQTPTTTNYNGGTYLSTAEIQIGADLGGNFLDGDINWVGVGKGLLSDTELRLIWNHGAGIKYPFSPIVTESLPLWDYELTRYAGNPVVSTADTGTGGNTAADPFLLNIGDGKLYMFFESTIAGDLIGQEWMAESNGWLYLVKFCEGLDLQT